MVTSGWKDCEKFLKTEQLSKNFKYITGFHQYFFRLEYILFCHQNQISQFSNLIWYMKSMIYKSGILLCFYSLCTLLFWIKKEAGKKVRWHRHEKLEVLFFIHYKISVSFPVLLKSLYLTSAIAYLIEQPMKCPTIFQFDGSLSNNLPVWWLLVFSFLCNKFYFI